MRAVLWGLALASLCLLQIAADVTVQPDFDPEKSVGLWYDIAVVPHAAASLKTENGHLITVVATKKGLIFHIQMPEKNCKREKTFLANAGKPGIYKTGMNTAYFLKTDYDNYAFILVDTPEGKLLFHYGREQQPLDEDKEAFRKLAASMNLPVDKIIYLKKAAPCPKLALPKFPNVS